MGMFLNYHDISDNYVPNNLIKAFPTKCKDRKLLPTEMSAPFEEYNAKGELEGYYWHYGDTLNLEFVIDGEICVENDSIILSGKNEAPTYSTMGYIGQRCYNIADFVSWTCTGVKNHNYIWVKDEVFTYPTTTDNLIYVSANDYLKDKAARITLYNFRMEPIHIEEMRATPNVILSIDKALSDELVKGLYYCSLEVYGPTMHQTIFSPKDCTLLVK